MLPQNTWMTEDKTLRQVEQTRELLDSGEDKVRLAVSLRKSLNAETAAFVLSQAELQVRGRKKFSRADQMLFTPVGLEQSTSEVIARFKAELIPTDLQRYDVCCGIGGDSIGLAENQAVTAIDRDETTCVFARHNLNVYGSHESQVFAQDFETLKLPPQAFCHIDPDRRVKGRTIRPENFSPNLNQILGKLMGDNPNVARQLCIKLAPSTQLEIKLRVPHRKQWIGHQRECKQQLFWLGTDIECDEKRVTIVDHHGITAEFDFAEEMYEQVVAPSIDETIFEPHSAILSADLVDEFASENGLGRLSYGSVYLTGPAKNFAPFAQSFRVLESCSIKQKVIKERLAAFDIGTVEWKSRGVDQKTVSKISRLRPEGSENGVVILTRLGDKYVCYICQRM